LSEYIDRLVKALEDNSAAHYNFSGFDLFSGLIASLISTGYYKDILNDEKVKEIFYLIERDYCPLTGEICGRYKKIEKSKEFFLAHDFNPNFFPVDGFRATVENTVKSICGLSMTYAKASHNILCDACFKIRSTEFGIYDMSEVRTCANPEDFCNRANTNVSIELGIAQGFGKKVIILNAHKDLADLQGLVKIYYEVPNPSDPNPDFTSLEQELRNNAHHFQPSED
jgi:hypothetical protein